jgi:hypothetical protein
MARNLLILSLIVCLLLQGCMSNPHLHGGQMVAECHGGDCPSETRTPYKATYVLYQWQDPPDGPPPKSWVAEQHVAEMYIRGLDRGEKIGFEKDAQGNLSALAGQEKIALPPGRYCWHISQETEYRGAACILHETGDNVCGIIALPFATAVGIVMLPIVGLWGLIVVCRG